MVALITIFPAEAEKMLLALTLITYLLPLVILSVLGSLESFIRHKYPLDCNVPISEESLHFDEVKTTSVLAFDSSTSNEKYLESVDLI